MSSVNFSDSLALSFTFWKPAVNKGKTDEASIILRTVTVGLAIFGALLHRVSRRDPAAALFIIPGTYGVMLLTSGYHQFEKWRAARETNRLALEAMGSNAAIEIRLLEQMQDHPTFLSAYLADPKCDKAKLDTVLDGCIRNLQNRFSAKQETTVFKLLVNHGVFQPKHFQKLIELRCDENLIAYALTHGKFSALTEEEAFQLWVYTASIKSLAPALIDKKIDINAKNGKGETPLAWAIKEKNLKAVCCLLRHGAAIPESIDNVPTRELLKEEPNFLAALDQAANPLSSLKDTASGFVLFDPAIRIYQRHNTFELSLFPLIARAYAAGIAGMLSLAAINPRGNPLLPISACLLLPAAYVFSSWQKGQAKLNEIAKTEFATRFPFHGTTTYLAKDKAEFAKIPDKELNKLDDEGKTLWSSLCSPMGIFFVKATQEEQQNFAVLVEKVFVPLPNKFPYFMDAIKSGQTAFIKILLEKVKAEIFTPEQHYQCFLEAQNPATIRLLKEAGFNINAKNSEGYTPLYRHLSLFSFAGVDLVQAFLDNGAALDKTHEITLQGKDEEGQPKTTSITVALLIAKTSRDKKYVIDAWEKKQEKV